MLSISISNFWENKFPTTRRQLQTNQLLIKKVRIRHGITIRPILVLVMVAGGDNTFLDHELINNLHFGCIMSDILFLASQSQKESKVFAVESLLRPTGAQKSVQMSHSRPSNNRMTRISQQWSRLVIGWKMEL
jgi:hypothetical protein